MGVQHNSSQLTAAQLDAHIATAKGQGTTTNGAIWASLLAQLPISEEALEQALNHSYGITALLDAPWQQALASMKVEALSAGLACVVDRQTYLLFDDPWSSAAAQAFARRNDGRTVLAIARPSQIAQLQGRAKVSNAHNTAVVAKPVTSSANTPQTSPVVAFVDDAIARAYADGASDIHFETDRQGVGIKYRLDGVMAVGARLDEPKRAEEIISRIKVLAQLDITERRRPQDGRIHWTHPQGDSQGDTIDLRVSIMPSIFGEDAVLRLLDKAQLRNTSQAISLDVLGFDQLLSTRLRELASRPHGMLLITGPTGSGKTTTVYAALSEVNDGLEKIVTIEDPVEYELPGVLQIPVNEQKGLTFATGLRSILRHDPDKILVGEIRDPETAEIAIQSALTGHLVFTTVHANSLFDVLGRFQHFGIDPFALASALNGIVVQRLLRRLCPHCLQWRLPTEHELEKLQQLDQAAPSQLPVACGCDKCRSTGYKGRFVVAEVFELTDTVRDLIVNKNSLSELKSIVYKDKSQRLLAQAMAKVAVGQTTIEEVSRVVGLV
jgi:general secretion pathway protein E